jgi:hypothetical protein
MRHRRQGAGDAVTAQTSFLGDPLTTMDKVSQAIWHRSPIKQLSSGPNFARGAKP